MTVGDLKYGWAGELSARPARGIPPGFPDRRLPQSSV